MPAATPDGLGAQLRRLRDHLAELTGLPCLIGSDLDAAPPGERYLQLEVIRLSVPPYLADQQVGRLHAAVLATGRAPDHADAADSVAAAMLAVLTGGRWELVPGQPDPELWSALGRPPAPAFVVNIAVSQPIERPQAPPVRHPVDIRGRGIRRIHGRVLAADGSPLADARIRLQPNGPGTGTGHDGRWSLTVPDSPVQLEVTARGVRAAHTVPASVTGPHPDADIDIVLSTLGDQPPPTNPIGAAETDATTRPREETEN